MPVDHDTRHSLRHVGLLADVEAETLRRLESRCRWQRYQPGREVVEFTATATDVYFLTQGLARVVVHASSGRNVLYRTIEAGSIFGEFAAIDGKPRSASVEILEPSTVACMPAREFRNAIADTPEIAMALLRHLTSECRHLTNRVLEFSTLAVQNRVQAELLRLAGNHKCENGRVQVCPTPTHSEIASRVSTHREAVTRELNRLRKIGVLESGNRGLVIADYDRLAEMVIEARDR